MARIGTSRKAVRGPPGDEIEEDRCHCVERPCSRSYDWLCGIDEQIIGLAARKPDPVTRSGCASVRRPGETDHMAHEAFLMFSSATGEDAQPRVTIDNLVELCFVVTRMTFSQREVQAVALEINPTYRADGLSEKECQALVDRLETHAYM